MPRHYSITGSATADGSPIYLRADGTWTLLFAEAHTIDDEDRRDAMVAAARINEAIVCDPYPIEVVKEPTRLVPRRFRERIRASGPTILFGIRR